MKTLISIFAIVILMSCHSPNEPLPYPEKSDILKNDWDFSIRLWMSNEGVFSIKSAKDGKIIGSGMLASKNGVYDSLTGSYDNEKIILRIKHPFSDTPTSYYPLGYWYFEGTWDYKTRTMKGNCALYTGDGSNYYGGLTWTAKIKK